jgi:alcohol dehydrogenase
MQDGYFDLGGDSRLDITRGRTLPFTLGHEIVGRIESAGPDAGARDIGRAVAIYPWIGCGQCAACRREEENLCTEPRHLGIMADGGFATHVLVPHPRYLLEYAPLSPALGAAMMCSGLTAYAALARLTEHAQRGPLLLIGLGGVGMMGLSLSRALFGLDPIVADTDAGKRAAATAMGVTAIDPADPSARKAVMAARGGVHGVCDFVGSDRSLAFAGSVLARSGGKIVVTGLLGGTFTLPAAMFAIKAMTIEGVLTGSLRQANALLALARAGKIAPIPINERPLAEAQAALDDLRAGRVAGRVVLTA